VCGSAVLIGWLTRLPLRLAGVLARTYSGGSTSGVRSRQSYNALQ
jgi:hypothetical protein